MRASPPTAPCRQLTEDRRRSNRAKAHWNSPCPRENWTGFSSRPSEEFGRGCRRRRRAGSPRRPKRSKSSTPRIPALPFRLRRPIPRHPRQRARRPRRAASRCPEDVRREMLSGIESSAEAETDRRARATEAARQARAPRRSTPAPQESDALVHPVARRRDCRRRAAHRSGRSPKSRLARGARAAGRVSARAVLQDGHARWRRLRIFLPISSGNGG